jgi:hypothetical protein
LKEKMILNRLQRWEQVNDDKGFVHLSPKYNVSVKEIGEFLAKITSR